MRTHPSVAVSPSHIGKSAPAPTVRRWIILCAATLVLFAIGQVYTWSVFASALSDPASTMRLDAQQASLPFMVALGVVSAGAFVGGRLQDAHGPRLVVLGGGMVFAAGVIAASFAASRDQLWLLVVGLRRGRRVRPGRRLRRARRLAAEMVPRPAGTGHSDGRGRFRVRRGPHLGRGHPRSSPVTPITRRRRCCPWGSGTWQ